MGQGEAGSTDDQKNTERPPDIRKRSLTKADIIIGFDLGTSCSKVILRDPARRRALAVPFRHHSRGLDVYLHPTIAFVSPNGAVSLQTTRDCRKYGDIKLLLLQEAGRSHDSGLEAGPRELAACYIALVLRAGTG